MMPASPPTSEGAGWHGVGSTRTMAGRGPGVAGTRPDAGPGVGPARGADAAAAVPAGAAVGDGLPDGGPGRCTARAGRPAGLGPHAAGSAVGPAGPGGGRRPCARPDAGRRRDQAGSGGGRVPHGRLPAAALCLVRGGALLARRRPRPDGQRLAQLHRRRAGGDARLPARAALARSRAGPDGGPPRRVQPEPVITHAGGDAGHPGALRRAGGAADLRLARAAHGRGAAAFALGRARGNDRGRRAGDGPGASIPRRAGVHRGADHPLASVLPARRPSAVARRAGADLGVAMAGLARRARRPGAAAHPGGHGDRGGHRRAVVRADGPLARLAGDRRAARPARAPDGRRRPLAARPADRAGAGQPAAGALRRRPCGARGAGRRDRIARIGRRGLLGDLARGRRARPGGLAPRAAERLRPGPPGAPEPAGRADDRRPGESPDPGPQPHLAGAGDGHVDGLVGQRRSARRRQRRGARPRQRGHRAGLAPGAGPRGGLGVPDPRRRPLGACATTGSGASWPRSC